MALGIQPGLPADMWHPNNHEIKPKSHYERSGSDILKMGLGTPVLKVVLGSEKIVEVILASADTGNQLNSLRSELEGKEKADFIEKLKQLPDYKGSKVESAVERGTIEIKKIPNRDVYAIYESKTGNLVYLTDLNGDRYANIDYFRTKEMLEDFFQAGYIRKGYGKIELDTKTGLWKLYKKDGTEVPIFSDDYSTATLNAINEMFDAIRYFRKMIEQKNKEK